jgi:hypothetical protein
MRELTAKEKELLVGGTLTMDTIYVYAPAFYDDWGYSFDLWNDDWFWEMDDHYYDGGDGGGGGVPVYECNSFDATQVEAYTDSLASKLARDIIAKPDHNRTEYLGFIYRDSSGVLRASELFGGTGASVSVNFQDLGFPVSQIVAVIHNHDDLHYGQDYYNEQANRYLSANDWATADNLVSNGANPDELSFYLLDTNNNFRQYDYSDRSRYVNSNGSLRSNAPLGDNTSKTLEPSSCPL